MTELTTNRAAVTRIWPYKQQFNPAAQPFSDEREADIWEELRDLTFDEDVRGNVIVATHTPDLRVSKEIVTEQLLHDDVVINRVQFWEPREVACNVYRSGHNEAVKKSVPWSLSSKANADDVIAMSRKHEIAALVLWEPYDDGHLAYLDWVVRSCPDLPIYIFQNESRADMYGVEREGNPIGGSLWDTQSEMSDEKELQPVIEHVAHEGESTWIFGYAKHGKTWIWLCVVKALLTGEPLFNVPDLKVPRKSKRVIYLCPEATRTSLRKRLKVLGLMGHLYDPITNPDGRLYLRSLSKGAKLKLDDPKLIELAKGADIFIDTAVRYLEGDENSSGDVKVLTENVLNLLAMGARSMWVAHHSGKSFASATEITLENCARGSSEFAAALTNAIGVVQLDKDTNLVHFHFIDGRDMDEPVKDMHLLGRPYLSQVGNFQVTENVDRFKGRNSVNGRPEDIEKQAKLDFALTIEGTLQEQVEAVNARFGSKHSKSTLSRWVTEEEMERKRVEGLTVVGGASQ